MRISFISGEKFQLNYALLEYLSALKNSVYSFKMYIVGWYGKRQFTCD